MKAMRRSLFLLAVMFLAPNLVQAQSVCSYAERAELNDIAANVKESYEVVDIYNGKAIQLDSGLDVDPEVDVYIKGFKISILNVTEDVYVTVKNDYDKDVKTFYNKDTNNGIASFETKNRSKLINYTIEVYANKYTCAGELLRKITLQTPTYNANSTFAVCDQYKDFYYCQQFLPSEPIGINAFFEQLEKYKVEQSNEKKVEEEKKESFIDNIKSFYNKRKRNPIPKQKGDATCLHLPLSFKMG